MRRAFLNPDGFLRPFSNFLGTRNLGGPVLGSSLGVFQRPLTLILLQKYRDTNGSRIVIQIGGVYTTFCQKGGVLLQKYCDRNGRRIAILFKSIRVRGRFDSPEFKCTLLPARSLLIFCDFLVLSVSFLLFSV